MTEIQRPEAARRRDRIKLLLGTMVETKEKVLVLITEAKDGEDHLALGYKSWPEYVSTEYAELLADLNREDRRFAAFALSQTGMSTRAIGPILGVSNYTVHQDIVASAEAGVRSPNTSTGREFFDSDEEMGDALRMAEVTDEQFDEALSAARADGDLSLENVVAKVTSIAPMPKVVTGLDGKNYTTRSSSKAKVKPRRRSLPDAFHDATYELGKITTRLEALHNDDRFVANRGAVRHHRKALFHAQTVLRRLIADLGDDDSGRLL